MKTRTVGSVLVVLGVVLCAFVASFDLLGIGRAGFDRKQSSGLILGQFLAAIGLLLLFWHGRTGLWERVSGAIERTLPRSGRIALVTAATVAAVAAFLLGARAQFDVNHDMTDTDQGAFMSFSARMEESDYDYTGTRNRMPLYPALQTLVYEPGMSDVDFFEAGKRLNVVLTLVCLVVIWLALRTRFAAPQAAALTAISAFTVFAYRAPFFHPAVLFYTLYLCAFVVLVRLFLRPSLKMSLLGGVLVGLAHLTKASVIPGLLVFSVWLLIGVVAQFVADRRVPWRRLASVAVLWGVFLATLFPYARESKERYGQYFYNVNTSFYIWYDSWEEAKEAEALHRFRHGEPQAPAEALPSLSRYLHEHSLGEISDRVVSGLSVIWRKAVRSGSYVKYFLGYLAFCLAVVAANLRQFARTARTWPAWGLIGLALTWSVAHLLAYAFYVPISSGTRLVLSQFLPVMFFMFLFLSYAQRRGWRAWRLSVPAFHWIMAAVLLLEVLLQYPAAISTRYGMHF